MCIDSSTDDPDPHNLSKWYNWSTIIYHCFHDLDGYSCEGFHNDTRNPGLVDSHYVFSVNYCKHLSPVPVLLVLERAHEDN